MPNGLRNFILSLLIFSLAAPSAVLLAPKRVEAEPATCLTSILAGFGAAHAGAPAGIASVPVIDAANLEANALNNGETTGQTVQRCIVEPMVTIMVRSLLNTFTAQTIGWINSGFKGSPLYVTNPQGFLTDIADQTIGQFINGLGPIGQILCSPFDFQLRLSLNLQFGSDFRQEIGCRLTDIQQNVQRAFTKGNFGQNGWDNWLQLTAYPQNNPYGAYINSVNALDAQIVGRQTINLKQLDWGKGFLSSVDPKTGQVSTPGSLIEDQLSKTLGVEVERVGLAKDLDAILGALANQLINQVLGPGGLLGSTRRSAGGGASPVARALDMSPGAFVARNNTAQNLPDGVLPYDEAAKSYWTPERFCNAFQNNLYFLDKTDNTIWTQTGTVGADGAITYGAKGHAYKTVIVKGSPQTVFWTVADYNGVVNSCKNYQFTSPVSAAVGDYNVKISSGIAGGAAYLNQTAPKNPNLALNKPARQSSIYTENGLAFEASKAVDGQKSSSIYGSAIMKEGTNNWWTVDLGEIHDIARVDVYEFPGRLFSGCVIVSSQPFGSSPLSCDGKEKSIFPLEPNPNDPLTSIPMNLSGRYIWIQQTAPRDAMILSEVQVFGPPSGDNSTSVPSGGSAISFSPAEQTVKPADTPPSDTYNPTHNKFSASFTIAAASPQSGLKARLKLLGVLADGSDKPVQFSTVFATGSLKVNDLPIDTGQSAVIFNQNFSLSPQNGSVTHTETGAISQSPGYNSSQSTPYLSYKLVEEIFKVSGDKEQILAAQTTVFKIQ